MATKQQWMEMSRHYEALAQGLVALHVRLELLRQENEKAAREQRFLAAYLTLIRK